MPASGEITHETPCFIEAFVRATEDLGIPTPYLLWGAIYAVATALGRHVWGVNRKGEFYPNLYVMLIGPPGTGKTQVGDLIWPFLNDLGVRIAPEYISQAAMISELAHAYESRRLDGQTMIDAHHLAILSSEFAETFQGYDPGTLAILSRWWDCPMEVRERKRHLVKQNEEPIIVPKVCCNMLTGIQPGILAYEFPKQAWQGGFLARTIFVYTPEIVDLYLRNGPGGKQAVKTYTRGLPPETFSTLIRKLQDITLMVGRMEETDSFAEEYIKWKDSGGDPKPKHPRLLHYNIRREHQLEKLSIISAASRGSSVLEGTDYIRARNWLEGTEQNIDEIFIEMSLGDELLIMRDLHNYLMIKGQGKAVPASTAWKFLAGKIPSQRIQTFIDAAENAGFLQLRAVIQGGRGMAMLTPLQIEDI